MAVRPIGGYDPNTGWPPDDSTGMPWQDDTVLPGQFKGGGAGFGPGGFQGAPRLTANPAGPPPGMSLSANPGGGAAAVPGDVFPPVNSTIPNNKSVGPFTGGTSTENGMDWGSGPHWRPGHIPPRWGGGPPPGFSWSDAAEDAGGALLRGAGKVGRIFNPLRRIPLADIVTPTDELAPPAADEFNPNVRPVPRGVKPDDFPDQTPKFPTPTGYPPVATDFHQPDHPSTMRYPMWPTPPAPAPFTGDPRNEPNNFPNSPNPIGAPVPTPIGSPAPAIPPRRAVPRAAGPAAQRQQPDLGHYGPFVSVPRPNADVAGGARGRQSVPYTTALDLSRLFQPRQQ
jgi:hypothetical protein